MPDHKPLFVYREEADGPEWLTDVPDYHDIIRPATESDLTPEAIAGMLDQDMEGANYHDFVGCHDGFVMLLRHHGVEPSILVEIMRDLVDIGGIKELSDFELEA